MKNLHCIRGDRNDGTTVFRLVKRNFTKGLIPGNPLIIVQIKPFVKTVYIEML